ncbi:hypothetical protein [Aeromicrobium sp. NPDC092404]|uniref:hypothetical protein n=1 Tax=Aeromicrobium sp. NPDC092404 TaxID=3154976 RepID=UPI00343DBA79
MSTNEPIDPQHEHTREIPLGGRDSGGRDTSSGSNPLGDLKVSTGSQSAFITIEMILYVLAVLGIFVTSAIIDEDDGAGFTASEAWFYVTLLTIGLFINRGLARFHSSRGNDRTF